MTTQSAVPTTTPTTPLAEPLDVHLVPGGGVDEAVLGLAWDHRVLAFLAQRFLFLEQNIVMFGQSITFYNSNSKIMVFLTRVISSSRSLSLGRERGK